MATYAEEPRFSIGIVTGYYRPSLRTLEKIIQDSNQTITQDPNFLLPRNPDFPAEVRNIRMDKFPGNFQIGLEMRWNINNNNSLGFTFSSWEGETLRSDIIPLLFIAAQSDPILIPREARYNVSIKQFWFDWRYKLLNSPKFGKWYVTVGLPGFAIADLTVDSLLKAVTDDPSTTFAAASSLEAKGIGFVSHFGFGGKYFITNWLSVSLNFNYVLGKVDDLEVERFFPLGFAQPSPQPPEAITQMVRIPTQPLTPQEGERLTFSSVQTEPGSIIESLGRTETLILELDGFEINGTFTFHF